MDSVFTDEILLSVLFGLLLITPNVIKFYQLNYLFIQK